MAVNEAGLDITNQAFRAQQMESLDQVDPEDYKGLAVRFIMHPHPNRKKSVEEGRPIFDEVPYVDIRTPGDRTSHIFRPAAEIDKRRWPRHWDAFERGNDIEGQSGTPLSVWPAISRAMVEELKYFNVHTVEQLAEMSDTAVQNFMGVREWITRARAFLAQTEGSREAEKLAAELEQRDNRITDLEQRLAALLEKLETEETEESEED